MVQLAKPPSSRRSRLEMLSMIYHELGIPLYLSIFFLICAIPLFWLPVLLYVGFMFVDPRPRGGAPLTPLQHKFRNHKFWKLFAGYYPVSLHRTVELAPCIVPSKQSDYVKRPLLKRLLHWWHYMAENDIANAVPEAQFTGQRYIFGYHPHGIIGMGALGAVGTEGAGWSEKFPGIHPRLLTLDNNFYLPFYREYLLSAGIASVSKQSCLRLLRNNQPICIIVGGARESLRAQPGCWDLVLNKRFGFVKLALQTGASLVPVLGFGENHIFKQVPATGILGKFHKFMTKTFGFTIPFFHARGIFNYDVGVLPYRRNIDVVVGAPLEVQCIEDPTKEEVQDLHDKYVEALKQLFRDNRQQFGVGPEKEMEITCVD